MDHILQNKVPWQHGTHKEWRSLITKQGLLFLDVQEREEGKEEAMHSRNYSTGSTEGNYKESDQTKCNCIKDLHFELIAKSCISFQKDEQ